MVINKPSSMFEDTHQYNSELVQRLKDPAKTAWAIVKDLDTSFSTGYDDPGAPTTKMTGISQHLYSTLNKEFDYGYRE